MRALPSSLGLPAAAVVLAAVGGCGSRSPASPSATASSTYSLTGTVRVAQAAGPAAPLPGAQVEITDGPFAGRSTSADYEGVYRLLAVSGSFHIQVGKAGYESVTLPIGPLTSDAVADVQLAPSAGAFTGRVTESAPTESTPIANASIAVLSGGTKGSTATTDANGEFTIGGLTGSADLLIQATGYQDLTATADLTAGDADHHFRLLPLPRTIAETIGTVSGSARPPASFFRDVHNAGMVVVEKLYFYYSVHELRTVEVWNGERLIGGATVDQSSWGTTALKVYVAGGARYEIRISGGQWSAVTISSPN